MNRFAKKSSVLLPALLGSVLAAQPMPGAEAPSSAMPGHTMTGHSMAATYQPYTRAAFEAAKGTSRVLFFHATWCPNCKRADADLRANMKKLPAGVTVFKTDYDKEAALKKQYGITAQHTFVLVDGSGKALKKWAGGGLKELVSAVQAAKP